MPTRFFSISTSRRDQGNGERQECAAPRRLHRTPVCAAPAGRGEKSDHGVEGIARQCQEHQQQDKSEPHILEPEVDSGKRATTAQRQHYENDREKPNGGEGERQPCCGEGPEPVRDPGTDQSDSQNNYREQGEH